MDYAAAIAMMVELVIVKIPHERNPLSSRVSNILKSLCHFITVDKTLSIQ